MDIIRSAKPTSTIINHYHQLSKINGLSPQNTQIKNHVSQEELATIFQNKHQLIKIAEPFLYELYNAVKNTGYFLELLDENGIILYMIGDDYILELVEESQMRVGAKMDIDSAGTNAISL